MDIVNKVTFEVQADLYEKEALAEIVKENCDPSVEMGKPYSTLQLGRRVIYMAREELANRVEVVRCKDCKHAVDYPLKADSQKLVCTKSINWRAVEPVHFCSYGERREGE